MMTAMVSDPLEKRSLDRHGAEDSKEELDCPASFERTVGEEPMVADCDAKHGGHVHAQKQAQFAPAKGPTPQGNNRRDQTQEGHNDRNQRTDTR
jgi:hypothetical protein